MKIPLLTFMVVIGVWIGTLAAQTPAWVAASTDMVFPGNDKSEEAHSLDFTSGQAGPVLGYYVRDAVDQGYFSYSMSVQPQSDMTLVVFYWGSDNDRQFKVLVNSTVVGDERLMNNFPGRFFERRYAVNKSVIGTSSKVTVKLLAEVGSIAGGAFGLIMMPAEAALSHPVIKFEEFYQQSPQAMDSSKREAELAAATLDRVMIADRASEEAHQMKGEETYSGKSRGRSWRDARDGGFFSYVLKVDPEIPTALVVTYDGNDRDRDFYIYLDDTTLASQLLDSNLPGSFQDIVYTLPPEQTRGKATVTIKFEAPLPGYAGGVFDLRTIPTALAPTLYPETLN